MSQPIEEVTFMRCSSVRPDNNQEKVSNPLHQNWDQLIQPFRRFTEILVRFPSNSPSRVASPNDFKCLGSCFLLRQRRENIFFWDFVFSLQYRKLSSENMRIVLFKIEPHFFKTCYICVSTCGPLASLQGPNVENIEHYNCFFYFQCRKARRNKKWLKVPLYPEHAGNRFLRNVCIARLLCDGTNPPGLISLRIGTSGRLLWKR
jgi:hypothetical protein